MSLGLGQSDADLTFSDGLINLLKINNLRRILAFMLVVAF